MVHFEKNCFKKYPEVRDKFKPKKEIDNSQKMSQKVLVKIIIAINTTTTTTIRIIEVTLIIKTDHELIILRIMI